jgi:Ca-activated chloride channel family protein
MILRAALAAVAAAMLQQPGVFRAETWLVVLHATVKNDRGELVTGLPASAFTVLENGKRQTIALFRRDDIPVSIGLLIDNSGSMRAKRARVEAAALDFARASNHNDEMFVLNFADKSRIDVRFTSDINVLEAGIARVDSIGGTALRDAVAAGEDYLTRNATRDRKVLVVVTDGYDNASVSAVDAIRTVALQQNVAVYAIGLIADEDSHAGRARHELETLTEATGGIAYFPTSLDQIDEVAVDLARQIRTQYTIGYSPANQARDGSLRSIHVVARGAGHLTVRTRTHYRADASLTP